MTPTHGVQFGPAHWLLSPVAWRHRVAQHLAHRLASQPELPWPPRVHSSCRRRPLAEPAHTAPLCTPLRCSTKHFSMGMFRWNQSPGGLVLLRQQTPLTRRLLVYFASGAYMLPCCGLLPARSLVLDDPRQADMRPSSVLQPGSRDWHCLSASPFHGSKPAHGLVWAPTLQLPPAHAGYVCCAVWKVVSAGPCLRNSFLLRTVRNS